jgi:ribonucleoside-diphosphate reductase alpha chain
MAHVLMLAALQPFLSGAASKTVNLPNDATVEDVSTVYREAHRLGVKAIALYRDGSKLTQPLAAAKPTVKSFVGLKDPVFKVAPETIQALREAQFGKEVVPNGPSDRKTDPRETSSSDKSRPPITGARGQREPLPARRRGETQKARVGGQTVYWRTGEYPDGRLGEIFIDLAGAGSTLDGFANSLAKITSIALQFGAPVGVVVDALLGVRFEPAGHVELHDRVRWCNSTVELIARDLAIGYLGRDDLANVVRAVAGGGAVVALDKRAVAIAEGRVTGETCPECGGVVVQSGTCRTCTSCGTSSGGCG